jgi:osmotically-inducible protein OsmY
VLLAGGCSPTGVAVGAGATVASAASEERGLSTATSDTGIRVEINRLWFDENFDLFRNVHTRVYEGRVMLTGAVKGETARDDAVRLAWQVDGVREIINEIQVNQSGDIVDAARDEWILNDLRARILFDKRIRSINYKLDTVNGIVYVIGVAQNRAELDRMLAYVGDTKYVRRAISHVLLKDDPRRPSP